MWEVPIVEIEALCQPNTKSNVPAEPAGGCSTWALGEEREGDVALPATVPGPPAPASGGK